MLCVVTFLWGDKYSPVYVERLAAGVRRHMNQPHRFICITERERDWEFGQGIERCELEDPGLVGPHCFARLRLFDPEWQSHIRVLDRLLCIDLDNVVTGPLDPLFDHDRSLMVLRGANISNPNPFNCSLFALRKGAHPEVWYDFSLAAVAKTSFFKYPDDQGWLWHKVPNADGWEIGPVSGVWAFGKGRGAGAWPRDNQLPAGARMVAFPGGRDPSQFTKLDWVSMNWKI